MYNWGRAVIISIFVLFLLLCPPCSAYVVDEQTKIIYGDGWTHYNYSDGTQAHKLAPTNYLHWDGEWRPKTEMNISSGEWPYLVEEFDTYYLITRFDDSLILSKTYRTYDFQPYKIGVQFTLTLAQLNELSTYHNVGGVNYWYLTIPQSLKESAKHLNWDNKLPTISNETGFVLNQSDDVSGEWIPNYKYKNIGGELRLYYNQIARSFGITSTEIIFSFNSYIINSSTGWANTGFEHTTEDNPSGNIVIGNLYVSGNNNLPDNFSIYTGGGAWHSWSQTSDYIQQTGHFSGFGTVYYYNQINYTNTEIFCSVYQTTQDSSYPRTGISYRFNESSTWHYSSSIRDSTSSGTKTFLFESKVSDNTVGDLSVVNTTTIVNAGNWYILHTIVNGTIFDVYKNNILVNNGIDSSLSSGRVGFYSHDVYTGDSRFKNLRVINLGQYNGNVTHWHDAGSGYQTASFIVNMTTPTNTNYTVWYADNGSSFTQIGGTYTGNQTPSISGTKYQNTDLRIVMNGNSTATPEEIEVTFVTETSAAGAAPNITSWQNNKTSNNTLDFTINISEEVNFNATSNQSITTWNWYKDTIDQSHNYDNITLNWSTAGLKHVVVNATNANGTSGSVIWNITVVGTGYSVSGTIYGAAGFGEGRVTVTLGSDSTTTSSSGAYSFTGVSAGTYTLTASKPGLQDTSTTITVSSDTIQDLTMDRAVSPAGGGQESSDWGLPFNISGPISRLDGLFAPLQIPSDSGKINLFWYCILGFGAFMFIDGTTFHFDNSRKAPVIKLKYLISAPLSLILMFLGLLYIGMINRNSVFFINTFDGLALSFSSAISTLLGVTSPLGAVGYVLVGSGILVLGVLIFIDGLAFCLDKSRENTFLKIKYQVLIAAGLGLGVLGAAISGLIVFY